MGEYLEAYELAADSEGKDEKQEEKPNCFRVLLACINKTSNITSLRFSWDVTVNDHKDNVMDYEK